LNRIQQLIDQAGSDISGKWLGHNHRDKLINLFITEIESYLDEAEGDIDYVRFLIDKNLKREV